MNRKTNKDKPTLKHTLENLEKKNNNYRNQKSRFKRHERVLKDRNDKNWQIL